MQISLYKSSAERNRVNKLPFLSGIVTLNGTLREQCSVLQPSIILNLDPKVLAQTIPRGNVIDDNGNIVTDDEGNPVIWSYITQILGCNYARIPTFDRWYFVTDITCIRNNLFRVDMRVDTLMSFRQEILAISPHISRYQGSTNYLIPDDLPAMPANAAYSVNNSVGQNPFSTGQSNWTYMITALMPWEAKGGMTVRATSHTFDSNSKAVLNWTDVRDMIKALNNPDFATAMGNLFANAPLESVISVRLYPMNLYDFLNVPTADDPDQITIGTYNTGVTGYLVGATVDAPASCSKWMPYIYTAAPSGASAWSYYADDVQVWVPFYGFINIAPEKYYGRYIWMKYTIEFDSGMAYINVYSSTSSTSSGVDEDEIIYICSSKIGVDIPVSQGSSTEQIRNSLLGGLTSVLSIAAAPASGGLSLAGLGSSIAGQLNNVVPKYSHGGAGGGAFDIYFSESSPFALVGHRSPQYPDNFASLYGYPYNEVSILGSLSGFVRVEDVHLEGFDRALDNELTEIDSALKQGVIV